MSFAALDAQWSESGLQAGPIPADLRAAVRRIAGATTPARASRLAAVPWVVRAFIHGIDKRVAFVVSQENACRYCYGATRTMPAVEAKACPRRS